MLVEVNEKMLQINSCNRLKKGHVMEILQICLIKKMLNIRKLNKNRITWKPTATTNKRVKNFIFVEILLQNNWFYYFLYNLYETIYLINAVTIIGTYFICILSIEIQNKHLKHALVQLFCYKFLEKLLN